MSKCENCKNCLKCNPHIKCPVCGHKLVQKGSEYEGYYQLFHPKRNNCVLAGEHFNMDQYDLLDKVLSSMVDEK